MSYYSILTDSDKGNILIDKLKQGFMAYKDRAHYFTEIFYKDKYGKLINKNPYFCGTIGSILLVMRATIVCVGIVQRGVL